MLELLQQRDLADGGRGHALLLLLQPDALQRHDLVVRAVARLVHHAVGPLADLLHLLEIIHRRGDAPGRRPGRRRGHGGRGVSRAGECARSRGLTPAIFQRAHFRQTSRE